MNALKINSSRSPTKFLQPANLTTYTISSLFSLQDRTRSSSLVTLARPPVSSSLQIINRSHMHHLTCGISSVLHSVNIILFTVLLVHIILRISPHHSHHLRSHHLSLPLPFTNPFLHSHSYSFRIAFMDISTELKGHCCFFSFWLRVLD